MVINEELAQLLSDYSQLSSAKIEEIVKRYPAITSTISQDLYNWAIAQIHHPLNFQPSMPGPAQYMQGLLEHARWIIDRVKDGTLALEAL